MTAHEIRVLLDQRPFPGFRVYISDGATYDVRHPEMIMVTARVVHIAQPPMKGRVPAGENIYCDPMHITRMEPMNGHKRKARAKKS